MTETAVHLSVGIIGVGHLAGYLVEGLHRAAESFDVILSPRNAARASELAARFGCRVAESNQDVVSASRVVILSTRPSQATGAAEALPWTGEHTLVSVAAGVRLEELSGIVTPARVVRAMPVSSAAVGESPTPIYPDDDTARSLFAPVGSVVALPDEESFEIASVMGAFYAWLFGLAGEAASWMTSNGVPEPAARSLAAGALRGAGSVAGASSEESLAEIFAALATPGGLTEAGLTVLKEKRVLEAWYEACDAALARSRQR